MSRDSDPLGLTPTQRWTSDAVSDHWLDAEITSWLAVMDAPTCVHCRATFGHTNGCVTRLPVIPWINGIMNPQRGIKVIDP